MSILQYFKRKTNSLPDPNGPLSSQIPPAVIESANKMVQEAQAQPASKKRGQYNRFTALTRGAIGKYSTLHGPTRAARYYTRTLGTNVNESTVRSITKAFKEETRKRRLEDDGSVVSELPGKKRGRPLLLGADIDRKVQLYIKKIRDSDGAVSNRLVVAGAKGIVLASDKSLLVENGGHVVLNKYWARSLLARMGYVKRKVSTAASKLTVDNFEKLKADFLTSIVDIVEMEEIPLELILNSDQTGIRLVPSANYTLEKKGSKRVGLSGVDDKRQITLVLCGTASGDFLPPQVIYKGTTKRCHPKTDLPMDWNITHSKKHWSTEETTLEYIQEIIIPYVKNMRDVIGEDRSALLIMDNFTGQSTIEVHRLLESNNIFTCYIPPNCTDRLQPMDLSVNKAVKNHMREKFESWYADQVASAITGSDDSDIEPIKYPLPVMRELGAQWLASMHEYISDNPTIIVNGFLKAGILQAFSDVEQVDGDSDTTDDNQSDTSMDLFGDENSSVLAYDSEN